MEGLVSKIPTKELDLMLAGWDHSHNGGIKVTFWLADEASLEYFKNATVRKGKTAGQRYAAVLVQLQDDETPDPQSVKPLTEAERNASMRAKMDAMPLAVKGALAGPALEAAVASSGLLENARDTMEKVVNSVLQKSTPENDALPRQRGAPTDAQRKAMAGFCGLAIKWCDDEHFQEWLAFTFPDQWGEATAANHAGMASQTVKRLCRIESRKELDTQEQAHRLFDTLIRQPYIACRKADDLEPKQT